MNGMLPYLSDLENFALSYCRAMPMSYRRRFSMPIVFMTQENAPSKR